MGNFISKLSTKYQTSSCPNLVSASTSRAAEIFSALYADIQLGDVESPNNIVIHESIKEPLFNESSAIKQIVLSEKTVDVQKDALVSELEKQASIHQLIDVQNVEATKIQTETHIRCTSSHTAVVRPTLRLPVVASAPSEISPTSLVGLLPITEPSESKKILLKLQDKDPEHISVSSRFARTCAGKVVLINNIYKLHNEHLLTLYELKKAELRHCTSLTFQERRMYHGTSRINALKICRGNLNPRLWKRAMYGQGVCFSPRSSFASHYCGVDDKKKVILVCRVLFRRALPGNEATVVPEPGYDSTCDWNGGVVVKYNDDVFIPEYVVEFQLFNRWRW